MKDLPIARELLEIEHERLMRDHYDDALAEAADCDGCARAVAVRVELVELFELSKKANS